MDAKVIACSSGSPASNALKMMAAMIKASPYSAIPVPAIKPIKPYTVLRCTKCQNKGTLQKVDGEYYCRKCVRVHKGDFNGR